MGVLNLLTLKMKLLLTSLCISFSLAQPTVPSKPTCEDCQALVSTISTSLTSKEGIAQQVEVLLSKVCPKSSEPETCLEKLPEFWAEVAQGLWPGYYSPAAEWMCGARDICGGPQASPLTCDGCKAGIRLSIVQLLSDEFVHGIIEELSGDEGCGQEKEPEKCRAVVAELIPLALPAIASAYDEQKDAPEICNTAVKDICQP